MLSEPAVHVLTHQVDEVTGGSVRRILVLIFLSIAVGMSIFMSALRILVPEIQLWMYLLPGFGLAVILSFLVPDLFVGMAFDAGGVASGPMTATFSLAFVQGIAARIPTADVVADGFGMIAIVAMMPIIAIELLGAIYRGKIAQGTESSGYKKSDQLEVIIMNSEYQYMIMTFILSEHQCHRFGRMAREKDIRGGVVVPAW